MDEAYGLRAPRVEGAAAVVGHLKCLERRRFRTKDDPRDIIRCILDIVAAYHGSLLPNGNTAFGAFDPGILGGAAVNRNEPAWELVKEARLMASPKVGH